jgi:hypothetical protein
MDFRCPIWSNVPGVVARLRQTCPPDYEIISVIGIKGRHILPCTWTVNYRVTKPQNWTVDNFWRDVVANNPGNVHTTQVNILEHGASVVCQHMMRVACASGPRCVMEAAVEGMLEGYAPELEHIDGVAVRLLWPASIEDVDDEDEGYGSSWGEDENV